MTDYAVHIALFVSFLWGVAPVIHKVLLEKFDPAALMVFSAPFYLIALVIFAAFHTKSLSTQFRKTTLEQWIVIAITSIFTAFLANLLYFYILAKHKSFVVSTLIYTSPVFTLILAWLFLTENINAWGLFGVVLVFLGVLAILQNT